MKNLIVSSQPSTLTTVTIEFKDFLGVEPNQLHSFSKGYLNSLPELVSYIRLHQNKIIEIPVVRIKNDGSFIKKVLTGHVGEMGTNHFFLKTKEDLNNTYEDPVSILIRFDSVLGMIPLHPKNSELNPLALNTKESRSYFKTLTEMRRTLKECLNVDHFVALYFRYDQHHPTFREGKYRSEGEVVEVNNSNIVYRHFRTFAYIPGHKVYDYVDLVPREEIDRFIAPDRYLQKIVIHFGVKNKPNIHDDED